MRQLLTDWGLDDWSLWLTVAVAVVVLYIARPAAHRLLRAGFRFLADLFLIGGHAVAGWSAFIARRCREQLIEHRAEEIESTIERERRQLGTRLGAELAGYPELHRRLVEELVALEDDFRASAMQPAGTALIGPNGEQLQQPLDWRARRLARDRVARLSRIVRRLGPIQTLLERLQNIDSRAQNAARRIETAIGEYHALLLSPERRAAGVGISSLQRFLVGLLFGFVAIGGAFLNFFLIERPMAEMVGENYEVAGLPLPQAAALVMIMLEASAGIALMEFWGVTRLVPFIDRLEPYKRTILTIACFVFLLALASIEAGLALVREDIIRASEATVQQIQGNTTPVAGPSLLPQIVQATLGFVIPFLLALIAVPLELLLTYGTILGGFVVSAALAVVAVVLRLAHRLLRGLEAVLIALYDLVIFLPLGIEQLVARWQARSGRTALGPAE
jgi:hypothetical protein